MPTFGERDLNGSSNYTAAVDTTYAREPPIQSWAEVQERSKSPVNIVCGRYSMDAGVVNNSSQGP